MLPEDRGAGQRAEAGPVGELILCAVGVGEVLVEMPRLGTQRLKVVALLVAALALVGVGNDVVVRAVRAVFVDPAGVDQGSGHLPRGLGLLVVPDIGNAHPAVGLALQDARLEEAAAQLRIAGVGRDRRTSWR